MRRDQTGGKARLRARTSKRRRLQGRVAESVLAATAASDVHGELLAACLRSRRAAAVGLCSRRRCRARRSLRGDAARRRRAACRWVAARARTDRPAEVECGARRAWRCAERRARGGRRRACCAAVAGTTRAADVHGAVEGGSVAQTALLWRAAKRGARCAEGGGECCCCVARARRAGDLRGNARGAQSAWRRGGERRRGEGEELLARVDNARAASEGVRWGSRTGRRRRGWQQPCLRACEREPRPASEQTLSGRPSAMPRLAHLAAPIASQSPTRALHSPSPPVLRP